MIFVQGSALLGLLPHSVQHKLMKLGLSFVPHPSCDMRVTAYIGYRLQTFNQV